METDSVSSKEASSSSRPKIHKCDHPTCDKAYSKPSLLEQHKRSHTNERPFKCQYPDCGKSFLRKSHLQAHLISHENQDSKPFQCSVCGKGVNTQQHLKRHEITHTKSFSCTYKGCSELFYKHQSLRHHILSVHEKKLTCDICNKSFSRPYRLAQHNIKFHSDSPVYQCDHQRCFTNFKTWSALQLHIKTEHPKLKCPVCGKGCVGKKGLKSHMISHDEEKMVKLWNCKYCNMGKFAKKIDLIEHYNTFHDRNLPDDLLKPNEKEQLEKLLRETDSSNTFSSLKEPILNGYVTVSSDEDVDNDIISETQGSQKSLDSLNSTLRSGKSSIIDLISNNYQTKKICCPKKNCNRKFSREYDLQRHLKWHEAHLKKIEAFLNLLEDDKGIEISETISKSSIDETPTKKFPKRRKLDYGNNNFSYDNEDSFELDELIDSELKSLKAGEV